MGLTHLRVTIANPSRPRRRARLILLLDSGADYSVIPRPTLEKLGIRPRKTESFILADGTTMERKVGRAAFYINGEEAIAPVVFGEKDDSPLLGVVTLENMGLMLDPFQRKIRHMRLRL